MGELSKLEVIVDLIKKGVYTRKQIIEQADCTTASFASYLATLRMGAKIGGTATCPMENSETGVMSFGLFTDWEASKAVAEKKPAKPLAERREIAAKKLTAAYARQENFEQAEDDGSVLHELKRKRVKLLSSLAKVEVELLDEESDDDAA